MTQKYRGIAGLAKTGLAAFALHVVFLVGPGHAEAYICSWTKPDGEGDHDTYTRRGNIFEGGTQAKHIILTENDRFLLMALSDLEEGMSGTIAIEKTTGKYAAAYVRPSEAETKLFSGQCRSAAR